MPRVAAWRLLRSGSPAPLREVDGLAHELGLVPRDRALLRRIVGTEVRRRGTLRALVRALARGKPSADLVAHLHVGLVQAWFLDRIPDHALVSETLRAVQETLGSSKVPYVNAVLRESLRWRQPGHCGDPRRDVVGRELHSEAPLFHDPAAHPLLWVEDAYSMPVAIYKRWEARLGPEQARALCLWALEEPPLSLRVARGERAQLAAELEASGLHPRHGRHPAILLVPASDAEALRTSAAFREGRVSVQGETALRAAEAVQAREGELVLDLCAAPGGKTAVLAAAGARVSACDKAQSKLARMRDTLARLGLAERVRMHASDGTSALGDERFDAVLIDAPCSNTGVLAQRPEARWRFGPGSRKELEALQSRLLAEGAARVRPGGRLVWSTCSLEPEENGRLVRAWLAGRDGWQLEEESEALADTGTTADSGQGPIDGGYFARLRRS